MKKSVLIFILLFNQLLFSNTDYYSSFFANEKISKSLIHSNQLNGLNINGFNQGLVVGFSDSNEVRIIDKDTLIAGDIAVVNNGKLIIRNSKFLLFGNIYVNNNAILEFDTCQINILQTYTYQFSCTLINKSQLLFNKADFQSNGNSWGLAIAQSSILKTNNSKISNGFITNSMSDSATADIKNTENPGEFIISNSSNLHFTNTNFFLIWLTLIEGSNVSMSLPSDSIINTWELLKQPNVKGINYNIKIDNCTNTNWCFLSYSGSKSEFTNTTFRACGIMVSSPDSVCISNIINNSKYDNLQFNLKDRQLSLINSTAKTWNFYGTSKSILTLQNCIFGEMIAFDTSHVNITNSICDGSGGYIGSQSYSNVLISNSLINTQFISSDYSFMIAVNTSLNGQVIQSAGNSIMAILNSTRNTEPKADLSSTIFELNLPVVEGEVNTAINVKGTARMVLGPSSPLTFDGYGINYSYPVNNNIWIPIGTRYITPILYGSLTDWNTNNLTPGLYGMRLTAYFNGTDSFSINSTARLDYKTGVSDFIDNVHKIIEIYPNPVVNELNININSPDYNYIRIFNCFGENVSEYCVENKTNQRINMEGLPSGIYMIEFLSNNGMILREKFLKVK